LTAGCCGLKKNFVKPNEFNLTLKELYNE
jgi:hypothetical protein